MKILAIHVGHNSTVAAMDGGEIKGALSQEKLDNKKNSADFPVDAINALCKELRWRKDEIDKVLIASLEVFPAICYDYLFGSTPETQTSLSLAELIKKAEKGIAGRLAPKAFDRLRTIRANQLKEMGLEELQANLRKAGLENKAIEHIEHHTCHARAAFHSFSPTPSTKDALIFTLDGSGDGLCATVSLAKADGSWKRVAETPMRSSLGGVYSNTTRFLGMKILEHEYKVMGLAPYAKSYYLKTYERVFKPVIDIDPQNPLSFSSKVDTTKFYDYLVENAVGERFDNIAAALQHLTEDLCIRWIKNGIAKTGVRDIYVGGGVFMNVKLNQRIKDLEEVDTVCFMPSCGDESNPIGACYDFAARSHQPTKPLNDLFLGIGYSRDECVDYIEKTRLSEKYKIQEFDDIEVKIAQLLASKNVVARFHGRCEWGARSLGNRAILAHPSYMESFYTVNDLIKSRDFWMPFAPSILEESASRYLENYNPEKSEAPYMICTYQATEEGVAQLRAAIHQGDHTLRPQVVKKQVNPDYYKLIHEFQRLSGVGAVLNTSFNLHGYPLVATPEQAIMTFENSGLQYLALGTFLISKA
ncbi:carbamoyltransferase C-terminal domain-containing protein [Hahella aquimaris]|uniref:carbamoyltransferase C-terminal domain-containing protein n=1 Tax=Hahella sp. HNIBRBA332 TaxID=3015983 RepID=UPI00273C148D|nr:carbamoyltransferase C-terminal domain-containing protein [Hahella sp. HNIBRBA332]WLQ15455.1 carbamoyltransferase C-terminal domain-containing protein [Hahella sp. HNIBRBA332]